MSAGPSRPIRIVLLGMLFCSALAIAPDLAPRFLNKPGYVWTPFNSANYRVGDLYYYAPWVRVLLSAGWPMEPPTAQEGRATITASVENLRAMPYVIGAAPGLLFSDFRNVLVGDHVISGSLFFVSFYLIAFLLLRNPWAAFGGAIAAYVFSGVWQGIPANGQFLQVLGQVPSLSAYFATSHVAAVGKLGALLDPAEYDYISDAFRYANLSLSGPLLTLHVVAAIFLFYRCSLTRMFALFVLSISIAFSYSTHLLVGYLSMMTLTVAAFIDRRRSQAGALIVTGLAVIGALLAIGYPTLLRESLQNSAILQSVYLEQGIRLGPVTWSALFSTLFVNKYLASLVVLLGLFWRDRSTQLVVLAVGCACWFVSFVTLLEPAEIWPRFLSRGVDLTWGGFVAAGCVRAIIVLASSVTSQFGDRLLRPMGALGLIVLCIVPASGFARFASRNMHNLSRLVPQSQWDAYEWIRANVPRRSAVATLNWDDMAFLAMYVDVDLVAGHSDLSGRTPEEQFRRFIAVWKLLGHSADDLEALVRESVPALLRRDYGKIGNPPFNTKDDYPPAELAAGLFYWPYVSRISGIAIADHEMKATNPDLVARARQLFDQTDPDNARAEFAMRFALVDRADAGLAMKSLPSGSGVVFQNDARAVFALPQAR